MNLALTALRTPNVAGLVTLPFLTLWLLDGFWKSRLVESAVFAFWIVDFFEWIVVPAVMLMLLHRSTPISKRDYGLVETSGLKESLGLVFLCTITLFLVNGFGTFVLGSGLFGYPASGFRMDLALSALGPLATLGTFYLSATAAICESIFALALPWLWFSGGRSASRRQKVAFGLIAATVFALGHWETGAANATGAFLFQVAAIAWYFRLKTLWPIIWAHFLIDLYWLWPSRI